MATVRVNAASSALKSFASRLARRPVRSAVVIALVALALFFCHNWILTDVQFRQLQSHRASQFAKASSVIRSGDAVAVLQIAKLNLNVVVAEGQSAAVLRGGPAHLPTTPLPGEGGNAVIAGRSSRYGAPFGSLGKLEPDDEIVLAVKGRPPVRYRVAERVTTRDGTVLGPTGEERLTLVTSQGALGRAYTVVTAARDDRVGPQPPTAPAVGAPSFESRAVATTLLATTVRVGALGALGTLALRARRRITPVTALITLLPLVGYGLVYVLPFEPVLSNLW